MKCARSPPRAAIKRQRAHIPVFLLRGSYEIGDQQRRRATTLRVLPKPFDGQTLLGSGARIAQTVSGVAQMARIVLGALS